MTGFPWRTALFISLALNLAVISAAVGAVASGARLERPHAEPAPVAQPMPGPRAFMQALPPEQRRQLRRQLMDDVAATGAQRTEVREARLALFEAARAEPYDAERVRAAFARVRAADGALAAPLHDALARALADVPEEQRRAALDAIAERGPAGAGGDRPRRRFRREP